MNTFKLISNFKCNLHDVLQAKQISNFREEKGFTVIELLAVIVIVAVLIAVVISNFYQTKLQFALSRVAYKLAQDIKRAQDMTLSENPNYDAGGYGVYIDIDSLGNKKYIIYADKNPINGTYDSSDYLVDTIDFSSTEPGVLIKEIDNITDNKVSIEFTFNTLTHISTLITPPPSFGAAEVILVLESDLTNTKTVSVNTIGLIEVK